jgi:hypothetical protein
MSQVASDYLLEGPAVASVRRQPRRAFRRSRLPPRPERYFFIRCFLRATVQPFAGPATVMEAAYRHRMSFSKVRLLSFALQRGLLVLFIGLFIGSQRLQRWLRYRLLVAWSLMTDPRWLLSFIPRPIRRLVPPRWQKEILKRL